MARILLNTQGDFDPLLVRRRSACRDFADAQCGVNTVGVGDWTRLSQGARMCIFLERAVAAPNPASNVTTTK